MTAPAQKPLCPKCASPDTVSYWDDTPREKQTTPEVVLRHWYPNARECVDCQAVWW